MFVKIFIANDKIKQRFPNTFDKSYLISSRIIKEVIMIKKKKRKS